MARTQSKVVQGRLAEAGRRIDEVEARAQDARDDTRVRVEQRVDALREREAKVRKKVGAPEARDEDFLELGREFDEIDTEIAIAVAQLELDSADDRAAFEAAVEQEIVAYRAYVEQVQARSGQLGQGGSKAEKVALSLRDRMATIGKRVERFRAAPDELSDSLRAGILAALDELDHAAVDARSMGVQRSHDR